MLVISSYCNGGIIALLSLVSRLALRTIRLLFFFAFLAFNVLVRRLRRFTANYMAAMEIIFWWRIYHGYYDTEKKYQF